MPVISERGKFVVQWLPAILGFIATFLSLVSQIGYVTTSLISAVVALVLWVVSNRIVEKASPQSTVSQPPKTQSLTTPMQMTPTLHSVCEVGPYKVEVGESRSILLNIKQGQRLRGHLVEVDSQPFDWYIADEKNMILLMNGERDDFKSIDEGYDKRAYPVSRKIPWKSRWFLILDTYGKQYSRKVRVDFEPVEDV